MDEWNWIQLKHILIHTLNTPNMYKEKKKEESIEVTSENSHTQTQVQEGL